MQIIISVALPKVAFKRPPTAYKGEKESLSARKLQGFIVPKSSGFYIQKEKIDKSLNECEKQIKLHHVIPVDPVKNDNCL